NPQRCRWNLHHGEVGTPVQSAGKRCADKTFPADHSNFGGPAVAQRHDQRDDPTVWKIAVLNWFLRLVERCVPLQADWLKAGPDDFVFALGNSVENQVGCGLRGALFIAVGGSELSCVLLLDDHLKFDAGDSSGGWKTGLEQSAKTLNPY